MISDVLIRFISVLRGRPGPDGGHLPLAAADPAPERRHARPLLLRAAVLRRHLKAEMEKTTKNVI